jgi:hypothetical protein
MCNITSLPYARLLCIYWYLSLLDFALSLNNSCRLSDKIILCQSARSIEVTPGLIHAGELIVWEWLSYDRLYNDPNNPPPSWETGRALAVCPLPVCNGIEAQLVVRSAKIPVRPRSSHRDAKLLIASTGSFKILSIIPLPASSNRLSFDGTLVLLTTSTRLLLIDPVLLPNRSPRKLWWLSDWEEEDRKTIAAFELAQAQESIQNGNKLENTMDMSKLRELGVVEVIEEFIEPVRAAAMLNGRIILGLGENTTHVWKRNPLRVGDMMGTN